MGKSYTVLLVDDSSDDRFFMRLLLEHTPTFTVIGEVGDGEEAIDYLTDPGKHPDIVLLDLKMPRKNGFDVLEWIKTQNLKNLKVAVLSGSWLREDITKSFALGAHAYFKKTSLKEEQLQMLSEIKSLLEAHQYS